MRFASAALCVLSKSAASNQLRSFKRSGKDRFLDLETAAAPGDSRDGRATLSVHGMSKMRFITITPARDEEKFLPRLIASMTAQTLKPARWIIIDDGSTDATA